MERRRFLGLTAVAGGVVLGGLPAPWVRRAMAETVADPAAYGAEKLGVIAEAQGGKVIAMDSLLQIYDPSVTPADVVIAGSYCGATNLPHALSQGVRGLIAHDAGIGKDRAGIGALAAGDTYHLPVAAVETMSASLSNGRSMAAGRISHVNETARALGITPGMVASEAGLMMLQSPIRAATGDEVKLDRSHREMLSIGSGTAYASSAVTNFPEGDGHANDVITWGAHMGAIAVPILKGRRFKGCIGNDCGKARNDSGIASLPGLNGMGIIAASVGTMSARIGDGDSTWSDGRISALNDLAAAAGITLDMPAAEAARLMLLA